jgi:hypothetical protein
MVTSPNRIDWAWSAAYTQERDPEEILQTLGLFEEVVHEFSGLMERWFNAENSPEAKRLAFGAVLLSEVPNVENGNAVLRRFLPKFEIDDDSVDFFYQINRRRNSTSGIKGLRINRLSKWSVSSVTEAVLEPQEVTVQLPMAIVRHAVRLELDVNTVPEFPGPIPRPMRFAIFSELVKMGIEISMKGDVP